MTTPGRRKSWPVDVPLNQWSSRYQSAAQNAPSPLTPPAGCTFTTSASRNIFNSTLLPLLRRRSALRPLFGCSDNQGDPRYLGVVWPRRY